MVLFKMISFFFQQEKINLNKISELEETIRNAFFTNPSYKAKDSFVNREDSSQCM